MCSFILLGIFLVHAGWSDAGVGVQNPVRLNVPSIRVSSDSVVGLTVWTPLKEDGGLRFVFPSFKLQSTVSFVQNYLQKLHDSPVYSAAVKKDPIGLSTLEKTQFSPFRITFVRKPQLAIIANRPGHMDATDPVSRSLWNAFQRHGAENYLVPLGLETVLSSEQLKSFHQLISTQFSGLVAIGGGDIDPALYGESLRGSKDLIPQRDRIEFQLIQIFINAEKGMFYGICRGHQMAAAVLGFKLIQDLPTQLPTFFVHAASSSEATKDLAMTSVWHPIQLVDRENPLAQATHIVQMRVNSRHHQAVLVPNRENSKARVIALEEGKIVEGLEFKNHRGLTVQFHPEDMQTWESEAILSWMVEHAQRF